MESIKNLLIIAISIFMIVVIILIGISARIAFYNYHPHIWLVLFAGLFCLSIGTYFLSKLAK